jgi:hypothetical protein
MNSEKSLSAINFFVCSTYADLKSYRDNVIKNIQSRAGIINAQEFFGARAQKPLATCLEEVDQSNVFIMFLGPRYGSVDPDRDKSFVECEYERAREKNLPIFAYIMDLTHPFPIHYVSTGDDGERLKRFKQVIEKDLTVNSFTTPEDLATKVYDDLLRELPERGFTLGQEEPNHDESAATILSHFLALPKLFHGRSVKFRAKLGDYDRADSHACEAFSYRYGATSSRMFQPTNSAVKDVCGSSLRQIFAQEKNALELLNPPKDTDVEMLVKTVQGEYSTKEPVDGFDYEPGTYGREPSMSPNAQPSYFDRRRVVVSYQYNSTLLCGLELVEFSNILTS